MKTTSRKSFFNRLLIALLVIIGIGLGYGIYFINSMMPLLTGYPAKYLCSAVFVSGRQQVEVESMDLNFSLIKYVSNFVDLKDSSVTSSFLWGKSKAIFRKGFGATLLTGADEAALRNVKFPSVKAAYNQDTIIWPLGNLIPDSLAPGGNEVLNEITEALMDEDAYGGHAFAFMVIHQGNPVAEAYQPQFNEKTLFQSWSMAKSFTNTLAGIMVKEDHWDINQAIGIPEWSGDERKNITYNHLMQAESGLRWNEDYGTRSDVTNMLYYENDFARFVFDQPLADPVGSKWYYSSGNPNVVTYQMRQTLGNDIDYYQFPAKYLFNKIGMPNAIFEVDASGIFVGSSYLFATARDYARYGLLHLQDGMFNGERVLPEGWVAYTTIPAKHSEGQYGSLFWLNQGNEFPSAPKDMFLCKGYDGQRIFMIPSKDLIVVVLGFSHKPDHVMNCDKLLKDIIEAIQ